MQRVNIRYNVSFVSLRSVEIKFRRTVCFGRNDSNLSKLIRIFVQMFTHGSPVLHFEIETIGLVIARKKNLCKIARDAVDPSHNEDSPEFYSALSLQRRDIELRRLSYL